MNPKEIKNMIDFIAKSGLAEVNIETEAFKIQVKRDTEGTVIAAPAVAAAPAPVPVAAPAAAPAPAPAAEVAPAAEDTSKYVEIASPMIGTFYRSPKPEDPAFVGVGGHGERRRQSLHCGSHEALQRNRIRSIRYPS